jgi:SWIM/SEC-C metal-binding protein
VLFGEQSIGNRKVRIHKLHFSTKISTSLLRYALDESYDIFNGEKMEKIYDGKKKAKLGTEKRPAVVHVQTEERLKEVASIFEKNGWKYTIGLEPDKPEDITDLEILLNPPKTKIAEKKVGRNEPCPCGSGKKYKKCCGK